MTISLVELQQVALVTVSAILYHKSQHRKDEHDKNTIK